MERITVAELVKRTGLSRGFFYKNELIRREMDDAIHRQEAIFKNRHPVAMDRKLENSVIELKIELLKAKAENEKLAEQNQEFFYRNEEMRRVVNEAMHQQSVTYNPKQIIIDMAMERTLVNAKTTIQELKLKIKKLEKENAELREELARVRKISKV